MTAVTAFSRTACRRRRSCPRTRRRPWAARWSPGWRGRRRRWRRGRSPSSCFSADTSPRCFAPWRDRAGRQTPTSGSCWGCSYLIHLQIQCRLLVTMMIVYKEQWKNHFNSFIGLVLLVSSTLTPCNFLTLKSNPDQYLP